MSEIYFIILSEIQLADINALVKAFLFYNLFKFIMKNKLSQALVEKIESLGNIINFKMYIICFFEFLITVIL
jgi:hypothetical protein